VNINNGGNIYKPKTLFMKVIFLFALYLFSAEVKAQDTLRKLKETMDSATLSKVEIESHYPGGDAGWHMYLIKNMRYPPEAISDQIGGTVVVRFTINEDGKVSDIYAESGPHRGGLKTEAIRVIKESGKWIPAIQNGHYVKSFKRVPIVFQIF
jgi:TonB family protein